MSTVEKYLKPEVINQIKRLDLRAQFIVKGFLQGLHASPFHGFSVEFSEHRKYTPGDDPKDIDWLVYAKTDKYYVKKFEAETNITGYLVMDLSRSMGYTYRQELTKFDYAICLAAALCYLMIHQQDPVGLLTFDQKIRHSLPPKSRRSAPGQRALAAGQSASPDGETDIAHSLIQVAAMLRHASLVMIFSDLLAEPGPVLESLYRLRHGGHDVILFHILDEAEVQFPLRRHGRIGRSREPQPPGARRRQLPPRLPRRDRRLPRHLPPRVLPSRHRLRAAGHQHAVRPGADRVFGKSIGKGIKIMMSAE